VPSAQYAHQSGLDMIPLMMEDGYVAKGGLVRAAATV
jgi:hypothetical protein